MIWYGLKTWSSTVGFLFNVCLSHQRRNPYWFVDFVMHLSWTCLLLLHHSFWRLTSRCCSSWCAAMVLLFGFFQLQNCCLSLLSDEAVDAALWLKHSFPLHSARKWMACRSQNWIVVLTSQSWCVQSFSSDKRNLRKFKLAALCYACRNKKQALKALSQIFVAPCDSDLFLFSAAFLISVLEAKSSFMLFS